MQHAKLIKQNDAEPGRRNRVVTTRILARPLQPHCNGGVRDVQASEHTTDTEHSVWEYGPRERAKQQKTITVQSATVYPIVQVFHIHS